MEETCIVTRATIGDLNNIVSLFDRYRLFYGKQSDLERTKVFIKNRLSRNESVIFIAKERDNLAMGLGFIQLYPSFSSVSMKKMWILNDLYVDETARKHGVARQLMKEVESFALQSEAKSIVLETAKDNNPAQQLYESLGYQKEVNFYHYSLGLLP